MGSATLSRGDTVGRFLILDELGRGGMGVVVSAYDPELDRRVALKLLHPQRAASTEARERLIREAKAMAKLRHPNTVTVYEVGTHGGQIFLAMEYAESGSLREWLGQARTQAEVIDAFVAAGRGLAAAHDAGMVHRDFKPENVLIGDGGLVQVTDFGLVNASVSSATGASEEATDLTQTGSILGTPAYMSPEQHRGRKLDGRTDQFSFCVALWEALAGERPFRGKTVGELRAAVLDGGNVKLPRSSSVPARVRHLIKRGLAKEPEERFPSMHELLDELARDEGDAEIGRRTRSVLIGLMGTLWTVMPLVMALRDAPLPTIRTELTAIGALTAVALIGGYWARDSLRASTFNRQMQAIILFVFGAEAVLVAGVAIADVDLVVMRQMTFFSWFVISFTGVLFIERRFWPSTIAYLTGFFVISIDDQWMWWAMVVANGMLTANCLWIWRPREGVLGRFKRRSTKHRGIVASTQISRQTTATRTSGAAVADTVAADLANDDTQAS